MDGLVLTDEQQAAVAWLVEQLTSGVSLVALRGLAGTGKTTLIPALRQALDAADIPVSIGSPTHRAAMILRRKGLHDATTLHAQALSPYFTMEYAEAMAFLGEAVPCRLTQEDDIPDFSTPWLIAQHLREDETLANLKRSARLYGAKKALESLGITGREHFDGFGPKQGVGCLVIDEASMLGREQLALCQQAFPLLCLVGDPGQLPPVKDARVLDEVPGIDLTQIHRQAADSPIIQLAYAARRGEPVWNQFTPQAGAVERWRDAPAATFLHTPLLVWRNDTRVSCTTTIRTALYGVSDGLHVGEPLVCRASSAADRAEGFYNNALFRVVESSAADPRQVTVLPEGSDDPDEALDVTVHLEELDGDRIDPRTVLFRFGYCLTVHTAQGGEWPTVAISQPDLLAYHGFTRRKPEHAQDLQQWLYTALTRAKQCVGFVTQHLFTQAAQVSVGPLPWPQAEESPHMDTTVQVPPSYTGGKAPLFVAPVPEAETPFDLPGDTPLRTDDIPDVAIPASVMASIATTQGIPVVSNQSDLPAEPTAALLQTTCEALKHHLMAWVNQERDYSAKSTNAALRNLEEQRSSFLNEHAQYQLSSVLHEVLQQGVQVVGNPYTAVVQAVSGAGYPVEITVVKRTADELVQALEGLTQWLTAQGYLVPAERLPF